MSVTMYFATRILLKDDNTKETDSLYFPVKATGYVKKTSGVTLAKKLLNEGKKRLKGAQITGVNLFPMSKDQIEAEFHASESTFPVYDCGPKLLTSCFTGDVTPVEGVV